MSDIMNPSASDDFEWVNTWASAGKPAAKSAPKAAPARPQEPIVVNTQGTFVAKTIDAEVRGREPVAQPPVAETPKPSEPVTLAPAASRDGILRSVRKAAPDPDLFVHPATRRFFAALRAPAPVEHAEMPPAPAAITEIVDVAPEQPFADRIEPSEPVAFTSTEPSLVPDADQLERDIADIELARDALIEPLPLARVEPRKALGARLVAFRNADSVPILVGGVVGVTLLIVFGAAASLISLR